MEAFAALSLAVRAMTGMVSDIVPDEARMKAGRRRRLCHRDRPRRLAGADA